MNLFWFLIRCIIYDIRERVTKYDKAIAFLLFNKRDSFCFLSLGYGERPRFGNLFYISLEWQCINRDMIIWKRRRFCRPCVRAANLLFDKFTVCTVVVFTSIFVKWSNPNRMQQSFCKKYLLKYGISGS